MSDREDEAKKSLAWSGLEAFSTWTVALRVIRTRLKHDLLVSIGRKETQRERMEKKDKGCEGHW